MVGNNKINYTVNDFIEKETDSEWKKYILNKNCIMILDQIFDDEPLKIEIYKNKELLKYISKINEYIQWIGGECKEKLIKYYNEKVDYRDEKNGNNWYKELEIDSVLIRIYEDDTISIEISGGDNFLEDHLMEIEFVGKEINGISYDG
jgi:hypothetical protein